MKVIRRSAWMAITLSVILLAGCASSGQRSASNDELPTSSDRTEIQRRASIRLQLAVGYYQQGQWQTALDEAKQAIQIDPNLTDAYTMAALTYMELGQTRLAEDHFQRAMKLAPNDPDLNNNFGWFLCQNGRPEQSIVYFDTAAANKSYQSPAKALANAGTCSLMMKNSLAAERYFNEAFRLDPTNTATNIGLARINYDRGEFQNARFYITRLVNANVLTAEVLWLGVKTERKLGNRSAENSLATQLRRRYPNSSEFASYQRGVFNE
ncbi:MAG TPA: type IV pilus biogenesis/stability protein PilW [Oxalicibacterium sp.]|uniref:type IV pilus biogenesis/stability protein PilW n=1 Tax=Oxalicibacterium sp. TaxID=2766525 RepID=UPI002C9C0F01|nr:type IV pilus biogenesis/stability protein PilW [Oxalicibacterium sp.]HWU97723.1 type IV pilus biogenesis/stability protein PilW [Oxalicibacterium sp.]